MKIIRPEYEILTDISDNAIVELQRIEKAARTCYKSEGKTPNQQGKILAYEFVSKLIKNGHEAMLEHSDLSVKFIADRGFSHEMVRHRLCSFAQESTRWCDYNNGEKFEGGLTFVLPYEFDAAFMKNDDIRDEFSAFMQEAKFDGFGGYVNHLEEYYSYLPNGFVEWLYLVDSSENAYHKMRREGCTPQLARSVLPNSLKTELVVTANYREWRNIFKLRTAKDAHPDMRRIMTDLLKDVSMKIPVVFDDIRSTIDCNYI